MSQAGLILKRTRAMMAANAIRPAGRSPTASRPSRWAAPAIRPRVATLTPSRAAVAPGERRSPGASGLKTATRRSAGMKGPIVATAAPG